MPPPLPPRPQSPMAAAAPRGPAEVSALYQPVDLLRSTSSILLLGPGAPRPLDTAKCTCTAPGCSLFFHSTASTCYPPHSSEYM
uniref:Uncharacterized protein n=1 Tax=Rousettus aegyptiacus TaxID=9407 RepID=A0A7J8CD83_ROUAE|nr:hypothetical protein HJG63_000123 [Rousettus aegyptiacus]